MSASFIKEGPPDHSSIPKVGVGKMFHQKNLERNPSKIALVNPKNGEEINYKTVLDVTTKLAKVLVEKGVTKNDFVTIISHNCSEFLMTFLATWYTGAKLTLLNPDYTSGEYAHFFDLYVPKIIFCSENVTNTLQNLKNLLKGTEIIIIDSDNSKKGFQLYQDLLESCVNDQTKFLNENINPETDTALILSSSGTTGLPKSVMLSHSNLRTFLAHLGDSNIGNMTETGTSLAFLPFFHIFGIGSALASLFHGTKSIIMGKFNPHEFFSYIETYKITNLYTVPSILQFIAKSPLTEKYDLSSLQDIVYGSAPVSAEIVQDITRKINKCTKIRQAYGMTETTGIITLVPINSQKFIGTVGKPANTVALKVCDAKTGEILGPNQSGEIRVKSGGVMLGYLGNVQATKDAFDDEGFLKTGDLGYYDEEDHFHIVDRLKELIKFKGFQVAPAELEGILMQHVGVLEAGVVGKPDDRAGELPTAFIVKNPKIDVTEEQLVGFVAERVSVPKHLHGGVVFLEKLPRNATGKLNRNELRDLLLVQ